MHWEVKVPRTTVNDDAVEILEWYVADEAPVEEGDPLCLVESSKASFEIAAEQRGFVKILALARQRVPIRQAVCLVYESLEELHHHKSKLQSFGGQRRGIDATKKAVALAEQLGIDLYQLRTQGVIRSRDVQEYYVARKESLGAPTEVFAQPDELALSDSRRATFPPIDDSAERRLLRAMRPFFEPPFHTVMWVLSRIPVLSSLLEILVRVYSVGLIGSAVRYAYYRNKLRYMGKDVRIDTGALFVGLGAIEIGDNCHIDANVKIVARTPERPVRIGRGVHIGAGTVIHGTGGITIGDYCALAAGSCVFSARTLPEDPRRPGHLLSMSHAAPQENRCIVWDSVVIEDYAFVGLNAVILPGVTVGRGAIINSGAVIARDIPAYSIVGASKASVVGRRAMPQFRGDINSGAYPKSLESSSW
jgi:acetyltransferase-like isoleucine patch superfamily enzyme